MGNSASTVPAAESYSPAESPDEPVTNEQQQAKINSFPALTEVVPFDNNSNTSSRTSSSNSNINNILPLNVNTTADAPPSSSSSCSSDGPQTQQQRAKRGPSFSRVAATHPSSSPSSSSLPAPSSPMTLAVMNKGLMETSITRVLVLYCGGTIGMKKDPVKGYLPLKNYLSSFLQSHDRFHDAEHLQELLARSTTHFDVHSMDTALGDVLLLPRFLDGQKRVAYQIHEVPLCCLLSPCVSVCVCVYMSLFVSVCVYVCVCVCIS
jgi:hypothetical protein